MNEISRARGNTNPELGRHTGSFLPSSVEVPMSRNRSSSKYLRRISTIGYNQKEAFNFELDSRLSVYEKNVMRSLVNHGTETEIKGEVVFGGNNFICCMKGTNSKSY